MLQGQKSISLQKLFASFVAVICALFFVEIPSANAEELINTQSIDLPDDVRQHLADDVEKQEVLRIAFPGTSEPGLSSSRSSTGFFNLNSEDPLLVDPENYIVEKRSNDVFIAYSAVKEGEENVTLDIRSINLTTGTVEETQQYYFSPNDVTGEMDAKVVAEGETLWEGAVDQSGNITRTQYEQPSLQYGTAYDACIRSVESLCAVGGGTGGAIACALLGTTGIGGLACAGILGLIAMFGCNGAKERVCGGARR